MSLTRKILENAKSGLAQLTQLVVADDEPLSHVDPAMFEAELAARKAARAKSGRRPEDNPLAKLAVPAARAERQRQGAERQRRADKERSEKEAKAKAAADQEFRRIKDSAAGGSTRSSSGSSSSGRTPRPGSNEAQLRDWYRALDLEVGADLAEVKSAYRKLMRKYHPDLHIGNAQRQKAATELSMRVTAAYNGLSAHLEKSQ